MEIDFTSLEYLPGTSPMSPVTVLSTMGRNVTIDSGLKTFENMKMDSNFAWLLCSLISAISWLMYITYYNSRVTGYIITRAANRFFVKDGFFKIGSFTLNALSGKIMFRDVAYITNDYSARVQDGYLIFRWWRSYVPKDVSEDLSHSDTRLSIVLNGLELHLYNRSDLYARLERLFGLEQAMAGAGLASTSSDQRSEATLNDENMAASGADDPGGRRDTSDGGTQRSEAAMARTWRDLIPVIKMDVSSGRLVFGNRLVPTTLSVTVEESHFVYSTKPPASTMDKLMHFSKCWAENVRVMLAPSPKYTGMLDEPPRYMGEGFVLMSTNYLELYVYMDEAGVVPERPVLVTLANGDVVESSPPMWGVDIKCGRGTDFSYGPWADRQREHLFKFFFPNDYQPLKVTPAPRPGDKRLVHSFDIRLSMLNEATIDLLFSKNKETNAVHVNVGAGSYLEVTLPWITLQDGYTTTITGQLLHLEATTSLQYRHLVSSETLEFSVKCKYPIVWNHHQQWELSLTGCKATVHLAYTHKSFFQDLVNDWSCKHRPDIMHFVPYTWRLGLTLKHCELLTPSNQYNWIDCSSGGRAHPLENAQLALCAHLFHLSFELPFDQFLPETTALNFVIQGESIDLSLYVPETHTSRSVVLALEKHARVLSKEGSVRQRAENIPKWRSVCQRADGWLDFWWVPIGAININWLYHPAPPLGPQPQADISTPVKEELLLSPMRFPHGRAKPARRSPDGGRTRRFDPTTLAPDKVTVELEIGPSVLLLYGTALRNFLHLKENVFGDDQMYTDMHSPHYGSARPASGGATGQAAPSEDSSGTSALPPELQEDFDHRNYRPLEVDVSIIMHDIQAHLLKNCSPNEPPCPVLLIERFGFEMKKRYEQTELQLLLSPTVLLVSDNVSNRSAADRGLSHGRLTLSSLQVRGHAMFSDADRALDEETVEYAWLLEAQLGRLSGKITAPQMHQLVTSLETLALLAADPENELLDPRCVPTDPHQPDKTSANNTSAPEPAALLQSLLGHGPQQAGGDGVTTEHPRQQTSRQTSRTEEQAPPPVPPSLPAPLSLYTPAHKLKYKFWRVAVDVVDLWLVEAGTALQCWISPIRVASCNLHGKRVGAGLSCLLYNGMLRQLTCHPGGGGAATKAGPDPWLEVANVSLGTLVIESVMSLGTPEQHVPHAQDSFLRLHDARTRRLWFQWPEVARGGAGRCGCTGGCAFFGNNRNGPRFFKPTSADLVDGINVACFRINDPSKDPGYGQSILHDGQLLFRTPPYTAAEILLQQEPVQAPPHQGGSVHQMHSHTAPHRRRSDAEREENSREQGAVATSPAGAEVSRGRVNRRFSYTLTRKDGSVKEVVPYARLVDGPALALPAKLDSDSKLHTDRSCRSSILDVPDGEQGPKNSVSDSKLAVDYFTGSSSGPGSQIAVTPGPVAVSESHHSLGAVRLDASEERDRLRKEVQRTTSMSSENQSEAFFSADEELNPSRTSSLRHSMIGSGSGGALAHQGSVAGVAVAVAANVTRKKFASDLSIVTDRTGIVTVENGGVTSGPNSLPEGVRSRLSSHRSDHEIHTPEHRSLRRGVALDRVSRTSDSPRMPHTVQQLDVSEQQSLTCDSSDSRSLSSNSYVSAVCSQEDMTLVDLHMQVNRQILDSPMLMSSYMSHLCQARCPNWSSVQSPSQNLFHHDSGRLLYVGGAFVPRFDIVTEGVTLLRQVPREPVQQRPGTGTPQEKQWEGRSAADMRGEAESEEERGHEHEEELLASAHNEPGSRTAVIVRLQGELHVTVTPLLLESLQRFVDALVPTLVTLHPLTVINHLHSRCVSQVVSANTLKRDQDMARRLDQRGLQLRRPGAYEECVRTQLQAAIYLPKFNLTMLQASVVEEIISFSALDNIKDLTCVSLFAVCFERITARFHSGKQAREVVQVYERPAMRGDSGHKAGKFGRGPMAFLTSHQVTGTGRSDTLLAGEPVYIETSEKQQEEFVVQLNVGRVHAQLRRLTNDSSILDDAVITAIPVHHSKVLFACGKLPAGLARPLDYYYLPERKEERATPATSAELGFIMFECGLEAVSIKVVKRSQFEKMDNGNEDKLTCKTDSDIYICAESVKSRDDVDSVDKSEASTQTTVTSQVKAQEAEPTTAIAVKENSGNTSSCVIELKTVWFNFAAPPRAPITRKLDYTRLDWNLLSTASPAIGAWMNPANRLAIRVVHAFRGMYRRSTAAMACLMAEALDVQTIHMPARTRYGRLTPLAKTLQEDPSCQLCAVLEKYVVLGDVQAVEASLQDPELPQLSTLRQGVIVLSRQWKNILYTPLLLDHNYKSKYVRPLNVTFTVPDLDEMCLTDGEASGNDDPDVTDECAMLLRTEALLKPAQARANLPGNTANQAPASNNNTTTTAGEKSSVAPNPAPPVNSPRATTSAAEDLLPESVLTSPSPPVVPHRRHRRALQPTQPPSSSRASVVFPILGAANNPFTRRPQGDESVGYGTLREDRYPAASAPPPPAINLGSDPSVCTQSSPELPGSPAPHGPTNTASNAVRSTSVEDLYSWMAKQQEYVRNMTGVRATAEPLDYGAAAKLDTLGTDSSGGDMPHTAGVSLYPMKDSLRLLDAHLIFQPLLSSLGVMPHQMVGTSGGAASGTFDSLGSNLSLVGSMDQMRIDIVVSEHGKAAAERSGPGLRVDCSGGDEWPAFVCERVSVELELEKVADMTVDDMIRTRNVLYISRGQLKKHTSTALNFSIAVRNIAQQVNMPLLRLLHQISNMYQNVKDTQNELREQQMGGVAATHHAFGVHDDVKNHSSSASDLQEVVTLVEGGSSGKPLSLKVSDPSSIVSGAGRPVISPSASVRSRPQSFAQKLRSTGKSVKGYMNLSEGGGTPTYASSPSGSALVAPDAAPVQSHVAAGHCWKTVYHLLDLYATMPDTKTITHRFSVAGEVPGARSSYRYDLLPETKSTDELPARDVRSSTPLAAPTSGQHGERTRLVVFGVARIHRTRLLATLSGLKLEAEITSLHSSLTWRKKSRPATLEFSLTGQVGRTMIVLLEGVPPAQQTVVRVTVGKSQALYSSVSKRGRDKNSGLLTVGAVNVDIPQHPVALHGMVTRGSKQLSSTLQELRVSRTTSRMSRQGDGPAEPTTFMPGDQSPGHHAQPGVGTEYSTVPGGGRWSAGRTERASAESRDRSADMRTAPHHQAGESLLQPLVMQFSIILQSLGITAALLPSLQAQYKMDQVNSTGVTGSRAKFTVDLPRHSLSFTTKLQNTTHSTSEANLPSEASIALPAVHVSAEYVPEGGPAPVHGAAPDGLQLRQGGYLAAHADIGVFEHSLTTDLLNHLVFVQKVFMKEVNEVVQKVYGGERPVVPLWFEDSAGGTAVERQVAASRVLFTLVIRIQRIQLTATTAGSSAVRLETGAVALELSNRLQGAPPEMVRLFGKAQVDVNLSLGQLTRNPMFEEAEPDFQQFAFFNTRIGLRNAFQDEPQACGATPQQTSAGIAGQMPPSDNKEVVLITLKRPLIYVQPLAVDKAILVWLNYKNAYDYWNEKRANLNKEVLTATQQVLERVGHSATASTLNLGTLFLQLTVDDMGICLPLNPLPPSCSWGQESRGAVVVTLESTSIAACSSGSLVSKGRFANLCLRFADDFDPSLDDWKPDMADASIVNLCVVSEGTYEVCSRTVAARPPHDNAKWILNVQWQMEGVDMNVDVSVGKQLSALGHTLTMLTGSEDGPNRAGSRSPSASAHDTDDTDTEGGPGDAASVLRRSRRDDCGARASQDSVQQVVNCDSLLPAFVFDPGLDAKKRSRLIEKEMNEQAKIINDLRSLGASHTTIEHEMRRLHELEALAYKDFRRDMIQKLRRQSVKASSIKGKLGLGSKASAYRSRSFIVASPTPDRRAELLPEQGRVGDETPPELDSSPRAGPSRSASLRARPSARVTFQEARSLDLDPWHHNAYIDVDGERVELRRGRSGGSLTEDEGDLSPESPPQPLYSRPQHVPGVPHSTSGTQTNKSQEPNIDFELDVKVLINSGKCVLHTKEPCVSGSANTTSVAEEQMPRGDRPAKPLRKDRSCSAGLLELGAGSSAGSPDTGRRHRGADKTSGSTRLQQSRTQTPHQPLANQLIDLTIFRIPGMDVKVHYESKVLSAGGAHTPARYDEYEEDRHRQRQQQHEEEQQETTCSTKLGYSCTPEGSEPSSERTEDDSDGLSLLDQEHDRLRLAFANPNYQHQLERPQQPQPPPLKKASLFAWMTLQSIPEETIISPHILEFLEQTLEPIPPSSKQSAPATASSAEPPPADTHSNTYNYVYASSFPVDVIVYFHMQPSTFRFSCLPVSRVECMLQLPSLDIVFSSKRADEEDSVTEFGPPASNTAVGGLSVTGCLADFNVYIFHPYGGGKKSSAGGSGLKDSKAEWSPLADSERKDSLSINVEFVKFHLSRSRKLNFHQDHATTVGGGGRSPADHSRAVIRFSTIVDIGSASFKYDMRRLTEILAFPKAWYRRSIVRRLFLGDLSSSSGHGGRDRHTEMPEARRGDPEPSPLSRSAPAATSTVHAEGRSPPLSARDRLRLSLEAGLEGGGGAATTGPTSGAAGGAWETLVLFAVNFTRLNVHMNMGNVMGNVTWQSKDFRSEGRLGIGSTGHKNMYIGVGLGGSALDAKGGIVGGTIELADIDTYVRIREEPCGGAAPEPDHTVGARLQALELRLDYMGTSVLMCRVSSLDVTLRDEWRLSQPGTSAAATSSTAPASSSGHCSRHTPTRRPATIFVHGVLGWHQLQCLISKSSTADLIKMYHKLEEFFSQQFNSSKRVFSRMGGPAAAQQQQQQQQQQQSRSASTAGPAPRHHRHWQRVLAHTAGLRLGAGGRYFSLPEVGTVLGGTMELHGQNVSLACFHGINFKSKSWALFSLREPSVSFNTEAQEIAGGGGGRPPHDVHIVQTLVFSLGLSTYKTHHSMATVCKVSRSVMFPPQFKSLHEWFHYAFASSQIDEVDRFPSLERERAGLPPAKLIDPNHTREVIFALPSLQLHLKTEHLQAADTPTSEYPPPLSLRPTVECSFVTEFEDHIFVTVDAEAFFFLHDLITSYLKERDRVAGGGLGQRAGSPRPGGSDQPGSRRGGGGSRGAGGVRSGRGTEHQLGGETNGGGSGVGSTNHDGEQELFPGSDWRQYRCKTWHLEPTVRLLSWAGKSIEPYGIDYILQKLGFSHARTTIPKWMQRGFMDPLDKVLAVLTLRMVAAVRDTSVSRPNQHN